MEVKLAVAIPTFNRAPILDDLLWSIGPQIERYAAECVCYVIDNDSTDNTAEVVISHQERWKNIHYQKNDTNIGLIKNIVCAITVPNAKWVWLLGDDDIPMPYTLGAILEDLAQLDYNKVNLLMMNGSHSHMDKSKTKKSTLGESLNLFANGIDVLTVKSIHDIAWLSILVVNRSLWDQALFERHFRETDLYTFVKVLLTTSTKAETAYTSRLSVLPTDRGSRSYYYSKTAIARLAEFPEIERMVVDTYGKKAAQRILKRERKNWLRMRLPFVIKVAVFREAYSKQQHLLDTPVSPFVFERFCIRTIAVVCRVPVINRLLKSIYYARKKESDLDVNSINKTV